MPNIISTYLTYANVQMAAEAYLDGQNGFSIAGLVKGNERSSKFPEELAKQFLSDGWTVVDHRSDTPTGFSGTLFRNTKTQELVMSFRSTEFADDAARDSEATNLLEIKEGGWAIGQITDMKDWYDSLLNTGKLASTDKFAVTGYSLGGHLATAFNILMNEAGKASDITGTYTFNGAGVGTIKSGTLTEAVNIFRTARNSGNADRFTDSGVQQLYNDVRALLGVPAPTEAQIDDAFSMVTQAKVAVLSLPNSATKTLKLQQIDFLFNGLKRVEQVNDEAVSLVA